MVGNRSRRAREKLVTREAVGAGCAGPGILPSSIVVPQAISAARHRQRRLEKSGDLAREDGGVPDDPIGSVGPRRSLLGRQEGGGGQEGGGEHQEEDQSREGGAQASEGGAQASEGGASERDEGALHAHRGDALVLQRRALRGRRDAAQAIRAAARVVGHQWAIRRTLVLHRVATRSRA